MRKGNKRRVKNRSLVQTEEMSSRQKVHFILAAPEVKEVYLAGEFNEWHTDVLPMMRGENGMWMSTLELLNGRHEYKLFVDGTWMEDRSCEICVEIASGKLDLESEPVFNIYGTTNFVFWM